MKDGLADLAAFACDHLPEGWTLKVIMQAGMLGVSLHNPDGDLVEPHDGPSVDLCWTILRRVNVARSEDGLCPIGWDGEHDPMFWEDDRDRVRPGNDAPGAGMGAKP